jgi:hypothetical protein
MPEKKSNDAFVIAAENGVVKRSVSTTDFQVGYPGKPAELHVTGKFSQSVDTVTVAPGQTVYFNDSTTILNVQTTQGSGVVTVILPDSPRAGQTCYVKDSSGTAAKNNLVVSGGKNTIDESNSKTLSNAYESAIFAWSGSSWALLSSGAVGGQGNSGSNGNDGYSVVVSPAAVTLAADNSGNVTSYDPTATSIRVFRGSEELSVILRSGATLTGTQYAVSATGNNITPGTPSSTGSPTSYALYSDASLMTSDTATITYQITIGQGPTLTQIQTITKARKGDTGATGPTGPAGPTPSTSTYAPAVDNFYNGPTGTKVTPVASGYYINLGSVYIVNITLSQPATPTDNFGSQGAATVTLPSLPRYPVTATVLNKGTNAITTAYFTSGTQSKITLNTTAYDKNDKVINLTYWV